MKKETLEHLMELSKYAISQMDKLEEVGIRYNELGGISDKLYDIILTDFGIPKDTTVELGFEHPNVFCRDYWCDALDKYEDGKIDIDTLIHVLENWRNIK